MKIIHYNILEGAQDDSQRLDGLLQWLKAQDADIVTLNELNGWGSEMAARARSAGYDHSTIHVKPGSSYHVGVMTRDPHEVLFREGQPFHHGLLGIAYQGVTLLITHLMPQSSDYRQKETKRIADIVADTPGPLILVGDLNTISPLDSEEYEAAEALQILQSTPALAKKFLNDDGKPDYAPMEILLNCGLTDLGAGQDNAHTAPTISNVDDAHALPLRIDYILANAAFCETWRHEVRVIRDADTDTLSDHYPLECVLT